MDSNGLLPGVDMFLWKAVTTVKWKNIFAHLPHRATTPPPSCPTLFSICHKQFICSVCVCVCVTVVSPQNVFSFFFLLIILYQMLQFLYDLKIFINNFYFLILFLICLFIYLFIFSVVFTTIIAVFYFLKAIIQKGFLHDK